MAKLVTRKQFKELEKEREGKLFEITFRSTVPEKFLIINTITGEHYAPLLNEHNEIYFKSITRGIPTHNVE